MFPDKIKITDDLIKLIVDTRKSHDMTAYQLSEGIGKKKSWLPNIENKRTKNILKEDLRLLFKEFAAEEDLDPEEYVIKHLPNNTIIELENNVSVPNHYLQMKMHLFPPNHEDLKLSTKEHIERLKYNISDKPYEVDLMELKKHLNDLANIIIDEFSYCKSAQERYDIINMVKSMYTNLLSEFNYTKRIYELSLFHGDSTFWSKPAYSVFENEISATINSFSEASKISFAKLQLYSSFEKNQVLELLSLITDKTSVDDLEDIVFEIESLLYNLREYIAAIHDAAIAPEENFMKKIISFFETIINYINSFLSTSRLDYRYNYELPKPTASLDILESKCSEINSIIFELRQKLRKRNTP